MEDTGKALMHTYVATQAAVAAEAYDGVTDLQILSFPEPPNVYKHYPDPSVTPNAPYFSGIKAAASNRIINFYNKDDIAMLAWEYNQQFFKPTKNPDIEYEYDYNDHGWFREVVVTPGETITEYLDLNIPNERYAVFAFAAQGKSSPLGSEGRIGGEIGNANIGNINLNTGDHKYTGESEDHSGQFRSINARRWNYYQELLKVFEIKKE